MKKALTKLGVGSVIALGLAINPLTGVQAVFAASDASNFEGFNAQLGVGYQGASAKVTNISGSNSQASVSGANFGQANGSSVAGTLGLGYTKALGDSFTLGVEAEYNPTSTQTGNSAMTDSSGNNIVNNKFSLNNQASISLVPGFAVNADTLVYAKVGYAMASLKSKSVDASNPAIFNNANVNGFLLGLGAKYNFTKNVYGFVEANAVQYGNASVSGSANTANKGVIPLTGTTNVNSYNGLVGVGYRF